MIHWRHSFLLWRAARLRKKADRIARTAIENARELRRIAFELETEAQMLRERMR